MEEPNSFEASSSGPRNRRCLLPLDRPKRMDLHTARGRYAGGWAGGEKVRDIWRKSGFPRLADRDVRGNPHRHRQPALGRRAVLPATESGWRGE
jgi:hypothetical protein